MDVSCIVYSLSQAAECLSLSYDLFFLLKDQKEVVHMPETQQ